MNTEQAVVPPEAKNLNTGLPVDEWPGRRARPRSACALGHEDRVCRPGARNGLWDQDPALRADQGYRGAPRRDAACRPEIGDPGDRLWIRREQIKGGRRWHSKANPPALSTASARSNTSFRWVVMVLIFLVYTMAAADRANIGIVLPFIKNDFNMSNTEAGAVVSLFFIGYSLAQIPAGFRGQALRRSRRFSDLHDPDLSVHGLRERRRPLCR